MAVEMTPEVAAQLRAPFPPEAVGQLPRVTCPDCSKKRCNEHQRVKCNVCNSFISPRHIHLDYVGHAEATDRFLQVDPEWTWEPMAFGQDGLPAMDRMGGLWIRLTIAGVTRIGYGHADGKDGPDAIKEAIGDGLRNAGMRFGVALDLWNKQSTDRAGGQSQSAGPTGEPNPFHSDTTADPPQSRNGSGKGAVKAGDEVNGKAADDPRKAAWTRAWDAAKSLGMSRSEFSTDFAHQMKVEEKDGAAAQFTAYAKQLEQASNAGAAS